MVQPQLPTELLRAIAGELATERQQGALAALALSSRLLATIVKPLLYRRPHFTSDSSLASWADSSPYRSRAKRGRRGEPSNALPEIHELSFSDVSPSWKLSSLTPLTHLRTLSFVDCDLPGDLLARLLGPLEPLRQTIASLTLHNCGCEPAVQFILQYLHYFDTVELEDVDPPTKKESAAKKSARLQKQGLKAITDWETFDSLLVGQHGTDEHTPHVLAARPSSEHPFSALDELCIDMTMGGGQELYLIFCTNLFPSLKKLHLAGSYPAWTIEKDERFFLRRSVHRAPPHAGTILPPRLTGAPPPYPPHQLWAPLTTKEIASTAFDKYKGPALDLLDMSKLHFNLV